MASGETHGVPERSAPRHPTPRPQRTTAIARAIYRRPWLINVWPPFLGAGIHVVEAASDWRYIRVELRQRWWNRNLVGTAFGGSMFAMCDPFYVVMLLHNLGPAYVVWDRATTIRFLRPGRGTLTAEFRLTGDQVDALRVAADRDGRHDATFAVTVADADGTPIAEVEKVVYLRSRNSAAGGTADN